MTRFAYFLLVCMLIAGLILFFWNDSSAIDRAQAEPTSSNSDSAFEADDKKKAAPQFGEDRVPAKQDQANVPIDGERALKYVKQLCEIGPRVSGSPGMARQQQLIAEHMKKLGATIIRQDFEARQLSQRKPVAMTNLIARWHPERNNRVILCSHYDTRPAAHEEPNSADWSKPFLSANDGTSGVAMLMELANHVKNYPMQVGLDIVFFDGEEYIFDPGDRVSREGDKYFFGSQHFAAEYDRQRAKLPYKYSAAILLDLCGGHDARLPVEGYSWKYAPQLVDQVWKLAESHGAKSFRYERGFKRFQITEVQDDHLALNAVGIPAIDIIDFDYDHWHRLSDLPDQCSPKQMTEVLRVLVAWLQIAK